MNALINPKRAETKGSTPPEQLTNPNGCNIYSGQTPSPDTRWITDEQIKKTMGCFYAAMVEGTPFNACITPSWTTAGLTGDTWRYHQMLMADIRAAYRRWKIPFIYVYARECGSVKGEHSHIALHLPKQHRNELRWSIVPACIERMGGNPSVAGTIQISPSRFNRHDPENSMIRLFDYMLKGADDEAAAKHGLAVDHGKAGKVTGRRVGQSMKILKTARRIAADGPRKAQNAQVGDWAGRTSLNECMALWQLKTAQFIANKEVKPISEIWPCNPYRPNVPIPKSNNAMRILKDDRIRLRAMEFINKAEAMLGHRLTQSNAVALLNAANGIKAVNNNGEVVTFQMSARNGAWTEKSYRNALKDFYYTRSF